MARTLLWSPAGQPLSVEADPDDKAKALLVELFGVLNRMPQAEAKWAPVGGIDAAIPHLMSLAVELVGPETIEATYGIKFERKAFD